MNKIEKLEPPVGCGFKGNSIPAKVNELIDAWNEQAQEPKALEGNSTIPLHGNRDTGYFGREVTCILAKPQEEQNDCCDKCHDVTFEKTYPAHTAYHACINLKCDCHKSTNK